MSDAIFDNPFDAIHKTYELKIRGFCEQVSQLQSRLTAALREIESHKACHAEIAAVKEELEKAKTELERRITEVGLLRKANARFLKTQTALAAAKEALQRIATHYPIDDGEEVKSLARHKCEQAKDALARIAECEKETT